MEKNSTCTEAPANDHITSTSSIAQCEENAAPSHASNTQVSATKRALFTDSVECPDESEKYLDDGNAPATDSRIQNTTGATAKAIAKVLLLSLLMLYHICANT